MGSQMKNVFSAQAHIDSMAIDWALMWVENSFGCHCTPQSTHAHANAIAYYAETATKNEKFEFNATLYFGQIHI